DFQAALEVGVLAADRKDLAIDQHDAVADADLVRQRAFRDFDLGELAGFRRIAHVDDGGPIRGLHVADIGGALLDDDLSSPRTIGIADDLQSLGDRHRLLQYKKKHSQIQKAKQTFAWAAIPNFRPSSAAFEHQFAHLKGAEIANTNSNTKIRAGGVAQTKSK